MSEKIHSRKVLVRGRGGPDVLQIVDQGELTPGFGQVRVRVHRAGVAFGDVMRRRGVMAPPWGFTPGYDIVGVVDALGSGVHDVKAGARVAAMMPKPGFGGYADHVLLQAARWVAIPDGVTDDTAITLGLNYITARQLIHRIACLEPGQSALVHGAAGGVGTALLDLGKLHGLRLFGTASKGKHEHLRERGCEPIDYRTDDFVERIHALTGEGVDAVFDGIGGSHLMRSYQALAPGGTLVSYGVSGDLDRGAWALVTGLGVYAKLKSRRDALRVRMYNITLSPGASPAHCRSDWEFLLGLAAEGKLTPALGAMVPLDEVQKAHRLMDEAAVMGKIVLDCEQSTSRCASPKREARDHV